MSKTDQKIRADYARDLESLRPLPLWVTLLVILLTFAAALLLADVTLDVLAEPYQPADWIDPCGDLPPIYGTDC